MPGVDACVGVPPASVFLAVAVLLPNLTGIKRSSLPVLDQAAAVVREPPEAHKITGPDQLRCLSLFDAPVKKRASQIQVPPVEGQILFAETLVEDRSSRGVSKSAEFLEHPHAVELHPHRIACVRSDDKPALEMETVVRPHYSQTTETHVHVVARSPMGRIGRRAGPEIVKEPFPDDPGVCQASGVFHMAADRFGGVQEVHPYPQIEHRLPVENQV